MRTEHPFRLLPWMAVFFIAMAFLESAVVVYLRALYYPDGFRFPLVLMDPSLVATEMGREFATLVMLLAPAALVARSALARFAWFCIGFGIWDIFYYVWLKVLLDWPASLLEPDLLFLLPVPWVGPVWAPCLISVGLIGLGLVILWRRSRSPHYRVDGTSWGLLVGGAMVMIASFMTGPLHGLWESGAGDERSSCVPGLLAASAGDFSIHGYAVGIMLATVGLCRVCVKREARAGLSTARVGKK